MTKLNIILEMKTRPRGAVIRQVQRRMELESVEQMGNYMPQMERDGPE